MIAQDAAHLRTGRQKNEKSEQKSKEAFLFTTCAGAI